MLGYQKGWERLKLVWIAINYLITFSLLLTGCGGQSQTASSSYPVINSEEETIGSYNKQQEKIIEKEKYYSVYLGSDDQYYYNIYDDSSNIIHSDCTFAKPAEITMLTDDIVRISLQAGTGRDTRWSYYYHVKMDSFSRVFYNVLSDKDNMLVYVDDRNTLIVRDIFNRQLFLKRISNLSHKVADLEEPFLSAKFSDDFKSLTVTYLTGDDNEQITESINLY